MFNDETSEPLPTLTKFERLVLHPTAWPTLNEHEFLLWLAEMDAERGELF